MFLDVQRVITLFDVDANINASFEKFLCQFYLQDQREEKYSIKLTKAKMIACVYLNLTSTLEGIRGWRGGGGDVIPTRFFWL